MLPYPLLFVSDVETNTTIINIAGLYLSFDILIIPHLYYFFKFHTIVDTDGPIFVSDYIQVYSALLVFLSQDIL